MILPQVENQYFPDDFYDIYNNQVVDEFSDPFVDELFMTEMFLTEILNLIESNYNLKLDTYLRLETISEDVLFKFDITESQEIIVNRATPIERSVYIIGFTDAPLHIIDN